jgi:hypothetical protein
MLIPLWSVSPFAGMPRFGLYRFQAVLSNAAPRGKRPRIAGAMLTSKPGLTGPAKRLSYWGAASVF